MRFCLASPNRQAPGPQTWRYVEGDEVGECTTQILTLLAASRELWKVLPDDDVFVGDDIPQKSGYEKTGKSMSVEDKVRLEERDDDFAEEGNPGL